MESVPKFKMAHKHEVIIIRKYKDIIDTDISIFKTELQTFLQHNPNEDVEIYLINMLEAYESRLDSCVEVHKFMSKTGSGTGTGTGAGTEETHVVRSKENSLGKLELEDDVPQLDFVICLKEKAEDQLDPPLTDDLSNEGDTISIANDHSAEIPAMLKACELQVTVVMKWKKGRNHAASLR
ncbi:uncharacterized protein [Anabrus simplex]|uniref:uncharacterized protein n=1 Tax=Anabrus simplex TaxID=316456 RepID=UPI0035A33E9A